MEQFKGTNTGAPNQCRLWCPHEEALALHEDIAGPYDNTVKSIVYGLESVRVYLRATVNCPARNTPPDDWRPSGRCVGAAAGLFRHPDMEGIPLSDRQQEIFNRAGIDLSR